MSKLLVEKSWWINKMKLIALILILAVTVYGAESRRIVDLRGQWKFRIGDNPEWAKPDFDDSDWEKIFAPSPWEDEGFNGYDGYAWYRTTFRLPKDQSTDDLYLHMGYIDDVDEVYVNGQLVGFYGSFPPKYFTAYNLDRVYRIPPDLLRKNTDNLIAVRVYDQELGGGIVRGRIGLYQDTESLIPDVNLEGIWKFKIGDNMDYIRPDYPDDSWKSIFVPSPWELQGYKDYDGIGWYRKEFTVPSSLSDQKLVLLLGMIDDLDETYLNGESVGNTGHIGSGWGDIEVSDEWNKYRAYPIDNDQINFGRTNIVAVRVYDKYVQGGIYKGPVGIITYSKYRKWGGNKKDNIRNILDRIFDF